MVARRALVRDGADGRVKELPTGDTLDGTGSPYNPAAVAITGGTINGATVGATTPNSVSATNFSATGTITTKGGTAALPSINPVGDTNTGIYFPAADKMALTTGGVTRVIIRDDGSVGIGETSGAFAASRTLNVFKATSASIVVATDDRNDGYVTPSLGIICSPGLANVGTLGNTDLSLVANNGPKLVCEVAGPTRPGVDNTFSLGTGANRWTTVFATNPIINTSDEREKTVRSGLSAAEIAAGKEILAKVCVFQWNESIAEKGLENARIHVGLIAQEVWAIMASHGLVDPIGPAGKPGKTHYAFLCFDEWDAEPATEKVIGDNGVVLLEAQPGRAAGNKFGLRYEMLTLFCLAASMTVDK